MNIKILDSISGTFKTTLILDIKDYTMLISHYQITQVTNAQLLFSQMRLRLSQWRKQYPFLGLSFLHWIEDSKTASVTDWFQGNLSPDPYHDSVLGIYWQRYSNHPWDCESLERRRSTGFSPIIF